ncbi:hypothetical protein acdb102_21070 [Acidothermaceae bacterium B102]|nr:hypothetical protein acdb102_21070 [Acidothermaceae bacterium B102]
MQPAKGTDLVPLSLAMSTMCPSGGTNVIGTLFGPGLPAIGLNVVPNSTTSLYPHTVGGGLYLSSNNTLRNLVNQLPDPPNLKGTYRVRVECRGPARIADLGDFYGSVVFDGHHGYVAKQDIPAASLVTVAAPSGPPIPTAVGSEAPQTAGSPTPTAVRETPIAATSVTKNSQTSYGPWLIALGILVVLGGIVTLARGRRSGKPGSAAR